MDLSCGNGVVILGHVYRAVYVRQCEEGEEEVGRW